MWARTSSIWCRGSSSPGRGSPLKRSASAKASRVPTVLNRAEFQKITGEQDYPAFLSPYVVAAQLLYYCNTMVSYCARGIHVW